MNLKILVPIAAACIGALGTILTGAINKPAPVAIPLQPPNAAISATGNGNIQISSTGPVNVTQANTTPSSAPTHVNKSQTIIIKNNNVVQSTENGTVVTNIN